MQGLFLCCQGIFCQITKSCKSYLSTAKHGQGKCYSYGQGGARAKARAKARARARATAIARAYIQRDLEQRYFMRTGTISEHVSLYNAAKLKCLKRSLISHNATIDKFKWNPAI